MRLCERGDLREHGHGFLWKFTHRRFAGEHHAIGAVENRVRHVSGLRTRRQTAVTIDSSICVAVITGLPATFALAMSCFCVYGDFLDRHFHAEIAARHHDSVGSGENLVEVRRARRRARFWR